MNPVLRLRNGATGRHWHPHHQSCNYICIGVLVISRGVHRKETHGIEVWTELIVILII